MNKSKISIIVLLLITILIPSSLIFTESYFEEYQGFYLSIEDNVKYVYTHSARIIGNKIELFNGTITADGLFTGYTLIFTAEEYIGNYVYEIKVAGAVDHSANTNHKSLYESFKILKYAFVSEITIDEEKYIDIALSNKGISDPTDATFYYRMKYKTKYN